MKKNILIGIALAIGLSGCALENQNLNTPNKISVKSSKLFDSAKWQPINNENEKFNKVVN